MTKRESEMVAALFDACTQDHRSALVRLNSKADANAFNAIFIRSMWANTSLLKFYAHPIFFDKAVTVTSRRIGEEPKEMPEDHKELDYYDLRQWLANI